MSNRQEKAKLIKKILNKHFPDPAIPLKHTSAFTLLIAVLLSARCTDERVNKVTPALFAKAKTPEEMIKLSIPEIQSLIRTCGLSPRKAKAIWHLSKDLIEKHHSKVPHSFEELEELPGVGHKTASVVMAQAFNKPAFPIDTHIERSAKRWGLSKGKNVKKIEEDLKELFPKKSWSKTALQIIYFGRKYCPARGHKADLCLICSVI